MSKTLRDKWIKRLDQEKKAHKDFRDEAEKAQDAYFGETSNRKLIYALFWSTVKVLHGRIYSQPPKPDVRKRYPDIQNTQQQPQQQQGPPPPSQGLPAAAGPPPGQPPQPQTPPPPDDNKLAMCIERAISYTVDTTDFDSDGHMAVNDLLVAALGVGKIEMDTKTDKQPVMNPLTGEPIMVPDENGEMIPALQEIIVDQTLRLRHFSWEQFRWEPQQHWSQVSWVGFDHWMTRSEIEDEFHRDLGKDGPGSETTAPDQKPESNKYREVLKVTEIWDKKTKKVIFVTDAFDDTLEVSDDKLGLEGFFPCPKPMLLNVRGDDLVPMPDYSFCEALFKMCNTLTIRIDKLTAQVRDIGFYDAAFPELQQLENLSDGSLIPITSLAARIEALNAKGSGYDAIVSKQDNANKVSVIQELVQLRDLQKQIIWEIYGVSDIQRGSSDPNETATAQKIKSEWADVRVGERIRIVALFFRDVFRIMGEIMAEKFQPEILEKMTGLQLTEPEIQLLRSDYGRCYAIDVESDSTVAQDDSAEKSARLEFLQTVSGYLQQILPAIQHNVMPADLGKELLLFAVNTFKSGRQLEQAINATPGTMQQLGQQQQQIQQFQQQMQQMQKQLQQTSQELQKVNQGKEQRENLETQVDAGKTAADTTHTQAETARVVQDIHDKAAKPAPWSPVLNPRVDPDAHSHVATPENFVA